MKDNKIKVTSKTIGGIHGVIMTLILTATALFIAFQGYVANQEYTYVMKNCEITDSEIIECGEIESHTRTTKGSNGKKKKSTYYEQDVQVRYYYDGTVYTKSFNNIRVNRSGLEEGDTITLYVDKNDPSDAKRVNSVSSGVFLYFIAGVIGFIDFMVIFSLISHSRKIPKKDSGDYNGISN